MCRTFPKGKSNTSMHTFLAKMQCSKARKSWSSNHHPSTVGVCTSILQHQTTASNNVWERSNGIVSTGGISPRASILNSTLNQKWPNWSWKWPSIQRRTECKNLVKENTTIHPNWLWHGTALLINCISAVISLGTLILNRTASEWVLSRL